jgi:hypothetical protein
LTPSLKRGGCAGGHLKSLLLDLQKVGLYLAVTDEVFTDIVEKLQGRLFSNPEEDESAVLFSEPVDDSPEEVKTRSPKPWSDPRMSLDY